MLKQVYETIKGRAENPKAGSYTNYLLEKGLDKICKKVGEESAEVIIAAKNNDPQELTAEIADLTYHLLVLMYASGLSPKNIAEELAKRK
jgi:phosphoribosyl-ATP pyrophosphohydrolase